MPKVIISCAITGSIHTPSLSPYLPVNSDMIAENAVGAAKAGAAIIHLHARNRADGSPAFDAATYGEFLPAVKASRAIVNITTGGSLAMTLEQRLAPVLQYQPELCSMNMGSMNFNLSRLGAKVKAWKYEWEKKHILGSEANVFRNTFTDIIGAINLINPLGTRYEFECYDLGHLFNLAYIADLGLIKPPFFVQNVFGILGGMGADAENVAYMRRTADRLFGKDYVWSVLAAGRFQFPLTTQAALLGGNVRVGLEDNLWLDKGVLAKNNAELVTKARGILESLSLEIATPDEARAMLGLKGEANVRF